MKKAQRKAGIHGGQALKSVKDASSVLNGITRQGLQFNQMNLQILT